MRMTLLFGLAMQTLAVAAGVDGVEKTIFHKAPPFFADYTNTEVSPIAVRLDLTKPGFLGLCSDEITLDIEWKNINSISYVPKATAYGHAPLAHILTVGFFDDQKVHHNAVVLLDQAQVKLLPQLELHTGYTIVKTRN